MAGHVPHRHGQPAVLERQHVIEVPAHLGGGQVRVGDVDPCQARRQVGKDRALDAPRRLQLHPLALALGDAPHVRRYVIPAVDELVAAQQVAHRQRERQRQHRQRDPTL